MPAALSGGECKGWEENVDAAVNSVAGAGPVVVDGIGEARSRAYMARGNWRWVT